MGLKYLLLEQMKSLRRDGFEVVGVSAPGSDASSVTQAGFNHIEIPAFRRRLSATHDVRAIWQLYKVFRREQPTIVHNHTPKPTVLATIAAKLARKKIVLSTVHGFYSNDSMSRLTKIFYSAFEWLGVVLSDHVLFRNQDDLSRARAWPLVDERKLTHTTGGIDLTRFDPIRAQSSQVALRRQELGIAEPDKVVGFVGRLTVEKGVIDLLEAAPLIRKNLRNIHLIFVGPNESEHGSLDQLATTLGVTDICHFVGQQDDVENWYSVMDVLVLPSYREGFPRAVMEASAMGLPVITTDVRGCRDAVVPNVTGLMVQAGNVKQLSHAVCRVLSDHDNRRRLGEQGRKFASENFDQEREFDAIKSLYQDLLLDADPSEHSEKQKLLSDSVS